MIAAIMTFGIPDGMTRADVLANCRRGAPTSRAKVDLVRSTSILDPDTRRAGGVFLWRSMEAARRARDAASLERLRRACGSEPVVQYVEAPTGIHGANRPPSAGAAPSAAPRLAASDLPSSRMTRREASARPRYSRQRIPACMVVASLRDLAPRFSDAGSRGRHPQEPSAAHVGGLAGRSARWRRRRHGADIRPLDASPRHLRGADLQGPAVRPVGPPCPCRTECRSGQATERPRFQPRPILQRAYLPNGSSTWPVLAKPTERRARPA